MSPRAPEVLEYVRANPGCTATAVRSALRYHNDVIGMALGDLVHAGAIRCSGDRMRTKGKVVTYTAVPQ